MTFLLKFTHLGKHNRFLCLLVSKFLMSHPKNVSVEPEAKYLPCQIMCPSNQFSVGFLSDPQSDVGFRSAFQGWVFLIGFFFPNWSFIAAVLHNTALWSSHLG